MTSVPTELKLLFDENLSYKLCNQLRDLFPKSNHVRILGLNRAPDSVIWEYAKSNGFTLVTQDSDFIDMAALYGLPPKIIWIRAGNKPTGIIADLIRDNFEAIKRFEQDEDLECLELF